MYYIEGVFPERIAGDLIYCISKINALDVNLYPNIYNLYKKWLTNNWIAKRFSVRDTDFFSSLIASEMTDIMKKVEYKYITINIEYLNSYSNIEIYKNFLLPEIDLTLDCFGYPELIYTTTDLISNKYPITTLDKTKCPEKLSFKCFVTSLLANSRFNATLNRYTLIYPEYKWKQFKCILNIHTLQEALKEPSPVHRSDFVIELPQHLFKFYLDDKDLKKYIKYYKKDPEWWDIWCTDAFRNGITVDELKLINGYDYYLNSGYKRIKRDKRDNRKYN
jgi:hypothetical protein